MGSRLTLQERINYIMFASLVAGLSASHIFIFAKEESIFRNGEIGNTYGIVALIIAMVASVITAVLALIASTGKFDVKLLAKVAKYGSMIAFPFLMVAVFMALSYPWTKEVAFSWQISDALIIFGVFTTLLLSWNPLNFNRLGNM